MTRRLVLWMVAPLLVLVAVVAVVVVAGGLDDDGGALPEGRVVSFEVPAGTAEAVRRGDTIEEILPRSVTLRVGDWLALVNRDDETHRLGPVVARPGETARVRFYESGRFDAQCTVGHDVVQIEVIDP